MVPLRRTRAARLRSRECATWGAGPNGRRKSIRRPCCV